MEKKFPNLNVFHTKVDDIVAVNELTAADFESATTDEKASMTQTHKSVSYWRDAMRRFMRNRVSVAALIVFILIALFAFAGPAFIPYSYDEQYRSAMKLAPMEFSESEQFMADLMEDVDAAHSTAMQQGSITSLKKGDYCFEADGKWYAFSLAKKMREAILILDLDADPQLYYVNEEEFRTGQDTEKTAVEVKQVPAKPEGEDVTEIEMVTSVFPHVFGTDSAGRDIMARCMYGARVSLLIGIIASLIVLVLGATYGSISGLCGGTVDFVMMRIVEIIYSVPDVLIVLLLQVVLQDPLRRWFDTSTLQIVKSLGSLGVGIVSIFITFALLYWVSMARIIRGQVLMLKQQEYVTAAKVLGASNSRIIKRHLLPNCVGQLVIATCLQIPSAIFLESFLSFLGLGISAPMTSLGSLCAEAIEASITLYPYRLVIPAVILSLLVLSLNLVGDGLRDALDPRLKK